MGMIRSRYHDFLTILRFIIRSINGHDENTIRICGDLLIVSSDLDAAIADDDRDSEDIPGYQELANAQAQLIERVSQASASTIGGLIAKAECALFKPIERGYDGGPAIGLSVCKDLLRLRE